jgi:hypothetical protein
MMVPFPRKSVSLNSVSWPPDLRHSSQADRMCIEDKKGAHVGL